MVVDSEEGSLRSSVNCFAEVKLDSSARENPVVPSLSTFCTWFGPQSNQSYLLRKAPALGSKIVLFNRFIRRSNAYFE